MSTKTYEPEKDLVNVPNQVPINMLKILIEQSEKSMSKIKGNEEGLPQKQFER